MFLVVGLGNPGSKYEMTLHNVGFLYLDFLASSLGLRIDAEKWHGHIARARISNEQAVLLKPATFMNLSGRSVAAAASFYKIEPERIIVIHDDLDLDFAKIKISVGKGPGGHNGIKSIINCLGSRGFVRIRCGIGRPPDFMPVEKYVLSKLKYDESDLLQNRYDLITDGLETIIGQGVQQAMNKIHRS